MDNAIWPLVLSGLFTLIGAYLSFRGVRDSKRIDSVDTRIETAFKYNDKVIERQDARIAQLESRVTEQAETIARLNGALNALQSAETDLRMWAVDANNWMQGADEAMREAGIEFKRPPAFPSHRLIY